MKIAEGFGVRARKDFIFVAEYGQPDRSAGGILLGEANFSVYRHHNLRYGEVLSVGPGRVNDKGVLLPMPDLAIGDVVIFSRKVGSRLAMRYKHPTYQHPDGLLIRVLDPMKCLAIARDFRPWWDVEKAQVDPGIWFSG